MCSTAQADLPNKRKARWKICRAGFVNPTSREATATSKKLLRFNLLSSVCSRASQLEMTHSASFSLDSTVAEDTPFDPRFIQTKTRLKSAGEMPEIRKA